MAKPAEAARYHALSILLHWLMFFLIVVVYSLMELRDWVPKDSELRAGMKNWHYIIGLSVFALVWIRLIVRILTPTPKIYPPPHLLQLRIGQTAHVLLYLFMMTMPLLGWMLLNAAGKPIPLFGLELPTLVKPDKALAKTIRELHELVGTLAYFLIGLHASAALFHHYYLKDTTVERIMPFIRQQKK